MTAGQVVTVTPNPSVDRTIVVEGLLLALVLTGLGVTSLSMAASRVAAVRLALSWHTHGRCAEIAAAARAESGPGAARAAALHLTHDDMAMLM